MRSPGHPVFRLAILFLLVAACDQTPPPPPLHFAAPGADWIAATLPDSTLDLRLPAAYGRPNEHGCWATAREREAQPGWRTLCADLDPGGRSGMRSLRQMESGFFTYDGHSLRGFRREETRIDGRPVIVERALVSGGIAGVRDERMMLVRVRLSPDDWAVLRGSAGDDAGYDELLAIARSVNPHPR